MAAVKSIPLQSDREASAQRWLLYIFIFYIGTVAFEGPIRWGLSLINHGSLIYFRDAVVLCSIAYVYLNSMLVQSWIQFQLFVPIMLLLTHFFASGWLDVNFIPRIFSLKLYLPFLYGAAIWPVFEKHFQVVVKLFIFLFLVTCVGVYVNAFLGKMPWEGNVYDTFFGSIAATKEWGAGDMGNRLPGLTRVSYIAAMMICITGMTWSLFIQSKLAKLIILIAGSVAIYLTTTKTLTLVFPVVMLWLILVPQSRQIRVGRYVVLVFFLLAVLLPVSAVFFDANTMEVLNHTPKIMLSMWERMAYMWPSAFKLLSAPEHYVFGRGFGGIGTSQAFGDEFHLMNAGDNIMVYLYVSFGILGVFYISYPMFRVMRGLTQSETLQRWILGILMVCFAYGITSNMIEELFFCIMLGLVYGSMLYRPCVDGLESKRLRSV